MICINIELKKRVISGQFCPVLIHGGFCVYSYGDYHLYIGGACIHRVWRWLATGIYHEVSRKYYN